MKHWRRGHLVACLPLILFLLWMFSDHQPDELYILQQSISDMCLKYERGLISGDVCSKMCGLKINRCLSCHSEYKIFLGNLPIHYNNEEVLIKYRWKSNHQRMITDGSIEWTYDSLYKNISSYLIQKFGERQFDDLVYALLVLADNNKDKHLSQEEAYTIQSLVRNNDFVTTVALATSDKVPNLIGYCGDIYVTRGLHSYSIPDESSWVQALPPWATRVHIAVSILEFIEDIQDVSLGNLLLCSLSHQDIGLRAEDEAAFYNFEWAATEREVMERLKFHPCDKDSDCTYGLSCHTRCGADGLCAIEGSRTNLPGVCRVIQAFLISGAPRDFAAKFKTLWDRCAGLNPHREDIHIEHSVILNNLKNSLWGEIQLEYGKAKKKGFRTS